jgi:hypothetical protein
MLRLRCLVNANTSVRRPFANATTNTSGGYTGTGYRYGNVVGVNGTVNTTSNTFASGTSVPLFKHYGQFLVIKYL